MFGARWTVKRVGGVTRGRRHGGVTQAAGRRARAVVFEVAEVAGVDVCSSAVVRHFTYVVAGGGAAGLSLAVRLARRTEFRESSILVVDREPKSGNDRTWCYWATDPGLFGGLAQRRWDRMRFTGGGVDLDLVLAPYRYYMLRSDHFYRSSIAELAAAPNVELLRAEIGEMDDDGRRVSVRLTPASGEAAANGPDRTGTGEAVALGPDLTEASTVSCEYLFDGAWEYGRFVAEQWVDTTKHHSLKQHFLGRGVRAPHDTFEVDRATLFDFQTPQRGIMRFVYTMPLNPREALVEYTIFSDDLLAPPEYDRALNEYLREVVGLDTWEVLEEESCIIPMTDYPFERRPSPRVLRIGTKGGMAKASTGYAFARIQRDSDAIVESLARGGDPFDLARASRRYRLLDSIMLQVLHRHGDRAEEVFTRLFARNPVQRVFGFLDEDESLWGNLKLMSTVPIPLFLRAAGRVISGRAP